MILLFLIFTGLLAFNATISSTFTFRYFGLTSLGIFTIYSLILLFFLFFDQTLIPKKISRINKLLLPFLSLIGLVLIILEKINYKNYVLQHLHIFPYSFIYLPLLGWMIFYISSFKEKDKFKRKIRILFPIILIIFCYLWIEHHPIFWSLVREDAILEYMQFIFYLLAGWGSFKIFWHLKNNKNKKVYARLFLLFSIALFFVSLEEISYGQRIFGWKTPNSLQEINIQNEINIHNNFSYDMNQNAYVLVGLYGISSGIVLKMFFKKKKDQLEIFAAPDFLFFYFLFLFLIYFDRRFINFNYDMVVNDIFRKYVVQDWLEVSELYLAIAFWAYTKISYRNIKANEAKQRRMLS